MSVQIGRCCTEAGAFQPNIGVADDLEASGEGRIPRPTSMPIGNEVDGLHIKGLVGITLGAKASSGQCWRRASVAKWPGGDKRVDRGGAG